MWIFIILKILKIFYYWKDKIFGNSEILLLTFEEYLFYVQAHLIRIVIQSINRRVWHRGEVTVNWLYARMHKAARHLTLKCRGAAPTAFMRVEGSAVSTSITHAQGFALCPLVCARGCTFDSVWVWRLTTFQGRITTRVFNSYEIWILHFATHIKWQT